MQTGSFIVRIDRSDREHQSIAAALAGFALAGPETSFVPGRQPQRHSMFPACVESLATDARDIAQYAQRHGVDAKTRFGTGRSDALPNNGDDEGIIRLTEALGTRPR